LNNSVYAGNVTAGTTVQKFTAGLSALASHTSFYYQIQFHNSDNGISIPGAVVKFTTLQPVVTTTSASSVTAKSANLSGTVNPGGSPGSVYFFWGTSPGSLNYSVLAGNVTPGSTVQQFNAWMGGLTKSSTYYYQVQFHNSDNGSITYGATLNLTTLAQ